MKYILGSGINALLAKIIMGSEWKLIPFGKSRFFSYNPAICDNFIIKDDRITRFLHDAFKINSNIFNYKCAFSTGGAIFKDYNALLIDDWLQKIFDGMAPPHLRHYYKSHMEFEVYDLRINKLYATLMNAMIDEIKEATALGNVTEIGDDYIIRNNKKEHYDKLINTIPQDAFLRLSNKSHQLMAKDIHILHIETNSLNFEKMNQLWVTDPMFDFYKATQITNTEFMIYCNKDIPEPGPYFMPILNKFDVLNGTVVPRMLPMGQVVNRDTANVIHVGSHAQWDVGMDVGSSIIKLLMNAEWGRGN